MSVHDWSLPPEHERSGWQVHALGLSPLACIETALDYCSFENPQPEVAIDYLVVALHKLKKDS